MRAHALDHLVERLQHQPAQFRQPLRGARIVDAGDDIRPAAELRVIIEVRMASTCPSCRLTICTASVVVPISMARPNGEKRHMPGLDVQHLQPGIVLLQQHGDQPFFLAQRAGQFAQHRQVGAHRQLPVAAIQFAHQPLPIAVMLFDSRRRHA